MIEAIKGVGAVCASISAIVMLAVLLFRPIREQIFGVKQISDGVRCLLRADMLRMYYKCLERREIRQHEYENFVMEFGAYRSLGGNSFMDHIFEEVKKWKVVT